MFKSKLASIILTVGLLLSAVYPTVFLGGRVQAAQLTDRSVTLLSSLAGDSFKDATVSFKNATPGVVRGIVFQLCSSALIGTTCAPPAGVQANMGFPGYATIDGTQFDGYMSGGGLLKLASDTGSTASAGETYSFTIKIDNPTSAGTYYARILTYVSKAEALAYSDTAPGNYTDYGSVALSATNDLTTTGIVTEILTFCVGVTDSTPSASDPDIQTCASSGFSGSKTVGLGIIGSSGVTTPVPIEDGGTNTNGAFLVKSNAVGGVIIGYTANQNNSSGALKIAGATCSGSSTSDGCINSAGTTAQDITGEGFGMTLDEIIYPDSKTGEGTSNLNKDVQYSWYNSRYTWDDSGTFDVVAHTNNSASKVLDYELGVLKFKAVSAPTTPSGLYSVSANFVATGTF